KFELDTGAEPTTAKAYDTTATVTIGLRVTTGTGLSGVATQLLKVTQPPVGGRQLGVSINHGAQFTRTPRVTVTAIFPVSTTSMLFSNDGGFFGPDSFPPADATHWT